MSVIFREGRDKRVCYFEGRFGRRNDGINLSVIFRGACTPKWLDTLVYDLQRNRGRRTNDASLSTVINFTKLLLANRMHINACYSQGR